MISFEEAEAKAREIPAHCGPIQGQWLFDLVRSSTPQDAYICEVGTFYGYMTTTLGFACEESKRRIVAVDHFLGEFCSADHDPFFYVNFIDNLRRFGVWDRIIPMPLKSLDAFPLLKLMDKKFHLIYLDGDHSFDTVTEELKLYTSLLEVGGFICGDDCGTEVVPFTAVWEGLKTSTMLFEQDVIGAVYTFFRDRSDFEVLTNVPRTQFGFRKVS